MRRPSASSTASKSQSARRNNLKILISRFQSIKNLLDENPNMEFVSMDRNNPDWWKGRTVSKIVPTRHVVDTIDNIKTRISCQAFNENPDIYGSVMEMYIDEVLSKTTPERVVSGLKRMFPGTEEFCILSSEPNNYRSPKTMFREWFNSSDYSKKTGIVVDEHHVKNFRQKRKYLRYGTSRSEKQS